MPALTSIAIAGGVAAAGGAVVKGIGEANKGAAEAKAAEAQQHQAQADRAAAVAAAEPSAQELAQLDTNIRNQEAGIARQEKLISAIDPTIVEASQQALKLLKGEEAGALNPIRTERARQRAQLESKLREQLGSGYQTSSAGSEALNRFDEQTASALQSAQTTATNSLLGVAASERNAAEGAAANYTALGGQNSSVLANIAARKVNAITGTTAGLVGTAGAAYQGDINAGKALSDIGGGLSSIGAGVAGGAITSGGGFSKLFGGGGTPGTSGIGPVANGDAYAKSLGKSA